MKKFIVGLGVVTTLLMSGCSELTFEETDASQLQQEASKGYINDTGYSDMFLEVGVLTHQVVDFSDYTKDLLNKGKLTDQEKNEAIDFYLETIATLKALQFNPETDYDFEMEDSARMYRSNAVMLLENLVKYMQSGDTTRLSLIKSYTDDMKPYNRDIMRIADKYDLR